MQCNFWTASSPCFAQRFFLAFEISTGVSGPGYTARKMPLVFSAISLLRKRSIFSLKPGVCHAGLSFSVTYPRFVRSTTQPAPRTHRGGSFDSHSSSAATTRFGTLSIIRRIPKVGVTTALPSGSPGSRQGATENVKIREVSHGA